MPGDTPVHTYIMLYSTWYTHIPTSSPYSLDFIAIGSASNSKLRLLRRPHKVEAVSSPEEAKIMYMYTCWHSSIQSDFDPVSD